MDFNSNFENKLYSWVFGNNPFYDVIKMKKTNFFVRKIMLENGAQSNQET